jgi:hypothetical protein
MEGPRSRSAVREARAPDGSRSVISRKELARELRRQAYQKAKARRAEDPKHLAMKEAAKVRRRELYQQVKERRKAGEAVEKAARSAKRSEERMERRASFAKQLQGALKGPASESGLPIPSVRGDTQEAGLDSSGDGSADASEDDCERALEHQVRAALGNRRVNELLQRLRLITNEPGITANCVAES